MRRLLLVCDLKDHNPKKGTLIELLGIDESMSYYDIVGLLESYGLVEILPCEEELSKRATNILIRDTGEDLGNYWDFFHWYKENHPGMDVYRQEVEKLHYQTLSRAVLEFLNTLDEKADAYTAKEEADAEAAADKYAKAVHEAAKNRENAEAALKAARRAEERARLEHWFYEIELKRQNW